MGIIRIPILKMIKEPCFFPVAHLLWNFGHFIGFQFPAPKPPLQKNPNGVVIDRFHSNPAVIAGCCETTMWGYWGFLLDEDVVKGLTRSTNNFCSIWNGADYPQRQVAKGKVCWCLLHAATSFRYHFSLSSPRKLSLSEQNKWWKQLWFLLEVRLNKKLCPVMPLFELSRNNGFKFQIG